MASYNRDCIMIFLISILVKEKPTECLFQNFMLILQPQCFGFTNLVLSLGDIITKGSISESDSQYLANH